MQDFVLWLSVGPAVTGTLTPPRLTRPARRLPPTGLRPYARHTRHGRDHPHRGPWRGYRTAIVMPIRKLKTLGGKEFADTREDGKWHRWRPDPGPRPAALVSAASLTRCASGRRAAPCLTQWTSQLLLLTRQSRGSSRRNYCPFRFIIRNKQNPRQDCTCYITKNNSKGSSKEDV